MHIPDGLITPGAAVAGYLVTGTLTWYSLRKLKAQPDSAAQVSKAALLTAAFFVASWIHIPVPPTSAHLVLNGLMGVVLGWYAFPAILVGLFLQSIMFQHGGLTTLGVNAAMMGIPALIAFLIFRIRFRLNLTGTVWTAIFGFLGGAIGLGLGAFIAFSILMTSIPTYIDVAAEQTAIAALTLAHVPLAVIEGVFTLLIVGFLLRVRPELVEGYAPSH